LRPVLITVCATIRFPAEADLHNRLAAAITA
jgi:hypothetical protein